MTTITAARTVLDRAITERAFQADVIAYALLRGWHPYHTHDSRRSQPGFPDLVLVRGKRLLFAELKSMRGRLSAAQMDWMTRLVDAGHPVLVWRPSDWPSIE